MAVSRWCGVCGYQFKNVREAREIGRCPKCKGRTLVAYPPDLAATDERRELATVRRTVKR